MHTIFHDVAAGIYCKLSNPVGTSPPRRPLVSLDFDILVEKGNRLPHDHCLGLSDTYYEGRHSSRV